MAPVLYSRTIQSVWKIYKCYCLLGIQKICKQCWKRDLYINKNYTFFVLVLLYEYRRTGNRDCCGSIIHRNIYTSTVRIHEDTELIHILKRCKRYESILSILLDIRSTVNCFLDLNVRLDIEVVAREEQKYKKDLTNKNGLLVP